MNNAQNDHSYATVPNVGVEIEVQSSTEVQLSSTVSSVTVPSTRTPDTIRQRPLLLIVRQPGVPARPSEPQLPMVTVTQSRPSTSGTNMNCLLYQRNTPIESNHFKTAVTSGTNMICLLYQRYTPTESNHFITVVTFV